MKTIFLTGATGAMGRDALEVLLGCGEFKLRILAHQTKRSARVLSSYKNHPLLTICYGNLVDYNDITHAMGDADYIVNLGAMVSPFADYHPELTMEVNVKSIEHLIKAVKKSGREDEIKLITIGSVAMSGNRTLKRRWARIGDPLRVSKFDHYGISKVVGERMLLESGLKNWVSLRQNAVLHRGLMDKVQAAFFHVPYDCCLEWVSAYDSAILIRNICRPSTPDSFWRNVYNIGGGASCRLVQHDIMGKMFGLLGIKDYTKIADLNWFATQNFHGFWASDSNELEDLFHFQSQSADSFFAEAYKSLPFYYKLAKIVPSFLMKHLIFRHYAFNDSQGPMYWLKKGDTERVNAFWGGYDAYKKIDKKWSSIERTIPSQEVSYLDHGYDASKKISELTLADLAGAATFRGGKLLAENYTGDIHQKLKWQCSCGEVFESSPLTILRAGHWCPKCDINWDAYDTQAINNKFLAQVVIQ